MVSQVSCIYFVSTFKELKELLETSKHRTYPLVDSPGMTIGFNAVLVDSLGMTVGFSAVLVDSLGMIVGFSAVLVDY
ncbi:hypothetical protein DPMN_192314 [Dreissena polymorpha]|uniref:Uncharacterized protein n=1 Tax=Dreissena polymorpha TaxID=45954 RepID=A0A9D3Y4U0_DREPO|nr:hypothetical protein DPMN_192314 [Dreissena polymorpha]